MKDIWNFIVDTQWISIGIRVIIIMLIACGLIKWLKWTYKKSVERNDNKEEIHKKFGNRILKSVITVMMLYFILQQFPFMEGFTGFISTSSSLLVAVLGFAAQEALGNVLSGIFISMSKPFNIGDRVKIPSQSITGTVTDINIRHTVIKTVENTTLLIPNSIMNREIIENSNFTEDKVCNFLDVMVSYESDIDTACEIIKDLVRKHRHFVDYRSAEEIAEGKEDVRILVRALGDSGVNLRCMIWTKTIADNFEMCSDLRHDVVYAFREYGIEIPYNKIHIVGNK